MVDWIFLTEAIAVLVVVLFGFALGLKLYNQYNLKKIQK